MGDISDRLVEALSNAKLIAAEDTRVTEKILRHFGLKTPLVSVQKFNEKERVATLWKVLKAGDDVALVSDAGSPNLSDPGAYIMGKIAQKGVRIEPIPGPSSLTALISISHIPGNEFSFGGFFPRKTKDAESFIKANGHIPMVFFESGKRIKATLEWFKEQGGVAAIIVGKELTKMHERVWRDLDEVLAFLSNPEHTKAANGEWVIMIEMASKDETETLSLDWAKDLIAGGLSKKDVVQFGITHMGAKRNELYKMVEDL